jgi:dUTP pyrophosphatase
LEKNNSLNLNFIRVRKNAALPEKATLGSAGWDLCACLDHEVSISQGEILNIPCGIAVELPEKGYAALVFSRSGLGFKYGIGLANSVGLIDGDYRGEIRVALCRAAKGEPYLIKNGDRIAQLVIIKIEDFDLKEAESINNTQRGEGGFGSTGR